MRARDDGGAVGVSAPAAPDRWWQRRPPRWARRSVVAVLIVGVVIVASAFVAPTYQVPSTSMAPLLVRGDKIVANRASYWGSEPQRGDVVVFRSPGGWAMGDADAGRRDGPVAWWGQATGLGPEDEAVVKRVIAIGGDTVRCCSSDGQVVVTSARGSVVAVPAPRGSSPRREETFGPVRVPAGRLWMMGDNRLESVDSRAHVTDRFTGTIATGDVVGRVVFRIAPLDQAGPIGSRIRERR